MIDAIIEARHAVIHVVSGALDVTYEVRESELYANRRSYYKGSHYVRSGNTGYVFDLVGATRDPNNNQRPYIFGGLDFDAVVRRALSKARHLERVWRNTSNRRSEVAA